MTQEVEVFNSSEIFYATMQKVGLAILDTHRKVRKGFPEVILAEGKNILDIINILHEQSKLEIAIATRVSPLQAEHLQRNFSDGIYHEKARVFIANPNSIDTHLFTTKIAVVTAGLSDLGPALEAIVILECAGYTVQIICDVGVAALQRLLAHLDILKECDVIIAIAGMDGALPSVIAGLLPQPVIAVPTSTGYGASQNGITAMHAMLSSCAPGLAVVNIDNGYGAAMMAHAICMRIHYGEKNAQ